MQRYRLTDNELALWLRYIEHQVGFVLPASQVNWVKGVIERHMQTAQMNTTALLADIGKNQQHYHQLFDDILIPRTQFFRHLPTFEFIEHYAEAWQQANSVQTGSALLSPFNAWSVGCSTGQEAVTLALVLAQKLGLQAFQVFGSDFHQQSLAQARSGLYDVSGWSQIPSKFHPWLQLTEHNTLQVLPILLKHITYFSQNLVKHVATASYVDDTATHLPKLLGQCQVIVCKNVLIYFRQFEQRDIVNELVPYLAPEGILLLGAGELAQYCPAGLRRIALPQINGFYREDAPRWLTALIGDMAKTSSNFDEYPYSK